MILTWLKILEDFGLDCLCMIVVKIWISSFTERDHSSCPKNIPVYPSMLWLIPRYFVHSKKDSLTIEALLWKKVEMHGEQSNEKILHKKKESIRRSSFLSYFCSLSLLVPPEYRCKWCLSFFRSHALAQRPKGLRWLRMVPVKLEQKDTKRLTMIWTSQFWLWQRLDREDWLRLNDFGVKQAIDQNPRDQLVLCSVSWSSFRRSFRFANVRPKQHWNETTMKDSFWYLMTNGHEIWLATI
jgi:hypothetical protein